jgi:ribosomal protein S18 acetylase RimI-like enzyme
MLAVDEQVAALASGISVIAFWRGQPAGFLGLLARDADPSLTERWIDVSIAAVVDGLDSQPLYRALLDPVQSRAGTSRSQWENGEDAQGMQFTGISALASESWLREALAGSGFVLADRVISYLRCDLPMPTTIKQPARLRALMPTDADALLALNAAAFEPLWRYDAQRVLSWMITADHGVVAELEPDGPPVGFALTTSQVLEEYAQLIRLAIHPDLQGQGIGRQLLVDAIQYAHRSGARGLMLNTQESNVVSRHMYHSLGFESIAPAVPVMVYRL